MKLKERIIDASIRLFNEQGTHRITTNHIIEDLQISPGTLYYHYKNKEEIIRNIFDRIIGEFGLLFVIKEEAMTFGAFFNLIQSVYELLYKYRFFYMDIVMLLNRDPVLRETYRGNMKKRYGQQEALYRLLLSSGVMRELDEGELRRVFDNLWIISDFWFSFLRVSRDKISEKEIREGVLHYFTFLKPYLMPRALKEIAALSSSLRNITQ